MIKKYEAYKDSGVEWIGDIPENWDSVRLKLISSITKGRKPSKDFEEFKDGLLPYLSMEFLRNKTNTPIFVDSNESNIVLVKEGDILILWDGSKSGEIVRAKKGVLSSTMAKIEIYDERFESNYLNYLLQLGEKHIQNNTIGMGIPHVNGNILKDLAMLLPSIPEQTQIAAYLDYQTCLIDAIIEKKELLIEKLKAQRQAIINEAVTGKIVWNGAAWTEPVEVKDSGIEWLGKIPAHWKIKKLKYLGTFQNGVSAGADYFGSGFPFVSYGDVYKNEVLPSEVIGLANSSIQERERFSVEKGDVFFTRTSETVDEIGITSICEYTIENAVFAGFLIRFRPFKNIVLSNLYNYYLRSFIPRFFFVKEMNLVTRASLSQELLKSLPILIPPMNEQILISKYLTKKVDIINSIIDESENSIQKLKSYRQSIISEAVTGKIDVRDWQEPKTN